MAKNITGQVARLFRIITILSARKDHERITRQQLADLIGCSYKTIQRDIKHLKDCDVPIEFNDQSHSYLLFNRDWKYPVINLTPSDVLALGLVRALISGSRKAFPYANEIAEALRKTTSCLTPGLMAEFESVGEFLSEVGGTTRKYADAPIGLLLQASMEHRTIEVMYESRSAQRGVFRPRKIDPYRLDRRDGQFFELQGYCHERKEFRTFAPDRMRDLKITDEIFERRSLEMEDDGVVGGLRSGHRVSVEVRFDEAVADYAAERGWTISPTFEDDPERPGFVIMRGEAQGTASIVKELLRWGRHAEVIGGAELREAMIAEIKDMASLYSSILKI